MSTGKPKSRPSSARIALLVALGVTLDAAFTAQGHDATKRCAAIASRRLDVRCPVFLPVARGSDWRYRDLYRASRDIDAGDDADDEAASAALAPTPQRVAERLRSFDGWSTAVLYEHGSSASSLRDAGLGDTTACVVLAGDTTGLYAHSWHQASHQELIRSWWLVLLDDGGREVGRTVLHAVRPHRTADDPELREVCVFHRTESGEIRTG